MWKAFIFPCIVVIIAWTQPPSWNWMISLWVMVQNGDEFIASGQFGDGREQSALEYVKTHATLSSLGDAQSILKYLDEYSDYQSKLVHIGQEKGNIIKDLIAENNVQTVIELGTYIGYSSIFMANERVHVISFDISTENQKIASELSQYAGLSDNITFIHGTLKSKFEELKSSLIGRAKIGLVLLDHHKTLYKEDLVFLEDNGFVKKDCIVVADNIMSGSWWLKQMVQNGWMSYFDTSNYTNYVRNNNKYSNKYVPFSALMGGLEISVRK